MTTHKEALTLALEALCTCGPQQKQAITAIKEALAQPEQPKVRTGDCLLTGVCASEGHKIQPKEPEQEPVAWLIVHKSTKERFLTTQPNNWDSLDWFKYPLYTTPSQRTWVGLTTNDWDEIKKQANYHWEMTTGEYAERVSHLVEEKLKEKNT